MARRPKAVAVVTNNAVVARIKPPPRPMMAISSAEPAEDQPHRLGVGALARRQIAAQRVDQIADRENAEPDGDDDRHHVRAPCRRALLDCSWLASHTSTTASAASASAMTTPADRRAATPAPAEGRS